MGEVSTRFIYFSIEWYVVILELGYSLFKNNVDCKNAKGNTLSRTKWLRKCLSIDCLITGIVNRELGL